MLTCYGDRVRLPQNDLTYTAFRLALKETLADIETYRDLDEEPDFLVGFLSEVPFLSQVPLRVQVDLLTETWARQYGAGLVEASLLDAAIVYASCKTAGHFLKTEPKFALASLRNGPRKVPSQVIRHSPHRMDELFDAFWDDVDFLLIDESMDLPAELAHYIKDLMRPCLVKALSHCIRALERWNISLPDVAANLVGLLTDDEIKNAMSLLAAGVRRPF